MHNQVYLVFESIRKLGFNPKDIKLLLISHAHYDHCGGARPIIEYTDAKVYMGKEDEYFLKERPDLIFTGGYAFGDFRVDKYYDDNRPITLGEMTIHTVHTPGHTPGTTSFFLDDIDEEGNVYRCGLHGGIGLNTLDDESLKQSGWPVSLRDDFLKGLLKLRDRKIDIVLASHPAQTHMIEKVDQIRKGFNPFLDPTEWKKLMEARIAMIKDIIKKSHMI
jgi:metallo-beta-lactamase class B